MTGRKKVDCSSTLGCKLILPGSFLDERVSKKTLKKDIDRLSWFEYSAKSVAATWSLKTK
jgi:hypothetical protein